MRYRDALLPVFAGCFVTAFCVGCDSASQGADGGANSTAAIYRCEEPAAPKRAAASQDSVSGGLQDSAGADSTRATRKPIEVFHGYPPVAGMDASQPGFVVQNKDPQYDDPIQSYGGNGTQTGWIAPVGFGDTTSLLGGLVCLGTVQVQTATSFQSDNVILDANCNVVREFRSEYAKPDSLKAATAYLVWDLKDKDGKTAPAGNYFWNARIVSSGAENIHRAKVSIAPVSGCK